MFASVHKGDFLSFRIHFYSFNNFVCLSRLGLNALASVGESSEKVGVKYEEIQF